MVLNFLKAILIGLAASIPLGPLGIMCIQKALSKGRWAGFAVGLGSSIVDVFYAAIALFSVSFISDFLDRNRIWVMLVGGVIILLIGLQIAMKNPIKDLQQSKTTPVSSSRHVKEVLRGFLMTISNPGALVLMLGLFAFFGLDLGTHYRAPAVLVVLAGIFLGTASWWFLLASGISLFRKRFRLRQMLVINRISGIIIALIGLASVVESLAQLIFHQPLFS
ncbi:MAG: LysE family transporter [Bacteroidales bacterium]|jgi:threonine/homoserine/homoserine lactone efflux protein|nr:LysE family transporter [Bacteroidales bacterium]MBR3065310.1 LysE family transporter [Bacteroidales bacterium]